MNKQSQNYTLRGIVVRTDPVESIGSVTKREVIVNDADPRYPSTVAVEFVGDDRVALLVTIQAGAEVEVDFFLAGREWGGRHYVSLRGIAIRTVFSNEGPMQ